MLCLLSAGKTTVLAASAFTLSWTHSVEKTRWEEDWRVTPAGLEIVEARVKGSGAGMEPPAGAVLRDGVWVWHPASRHAVLRLTRSAYTADYDWCDAAAGCRPLARILPSDGGVTELRACPGAPPPPSP